MFMARCFFKDSLCLQHVVSFTNIISQVPDPSLNRNINQYSPYIPTIVGGRNQSTCHA